MKLDNKGVAISGILYAVMILFLTIIISLLALISNRKMVLDKYKREVKELINNSEETFGARIQFANNTTSIKITEDELANYDFRDYVAACLNANISGPKNILCRNNEIDVSNILAYRIYDEIGNEVKFKFNEITSSDNYKINVATYSYYDKDANGNYVLDATNTTLKKITKSLELNKDNKFFIKYSVLDNNNILSKEVTRTLIVSKYNYYINILDNYFTISSNDLINETNRNNYFKEKAKCYRYTGSELVNSSDLKYELYSSDEIITKWEIKNDVLTYTTSSGSKTIQSTDQFHARYFVNELANSKAQIKDVYFFVD